MRLLRVRPLRMGVLRVRLIRLRELRMRLVLGERRLLVGRHLRRELWLLLLTFLVAALGVLEPDEHADDDHEDENAEHSPEPVDLFTFAATTSAPAAAPGSIPGPPPTPCCRTTPAVPGRSTHRRQASAIPPSTN
ncbi:hypothetical protein [Nocardia cyriacigeorgica]|uniref:hypothetical protein n=1 Tax=Nocardia cyriacigeorgica TaxID=135487 RepID=UPI0024570F51|nr:hypothetical protein [Nocardia cyriacigeorgica]